MEDIKTISITD